MFLLYFYCAIWTLIDVAHLVNNIPMSEKSIVDGTMALFFLILVTMMGDKVSSTARHFIAGVTLVVFINMVSHNPPDFLVRYDLAYRLAHLDRFLHETVHHWARLHDDVMRFVLNLF